VYHSKDGLTILKNFLVGIAGLKQTWTPDSFVETTVRELKEKLRKEFTRVTKGHKTIAMPVQDSVCDPSHPDHEKAKKILNEGF